MTEDRELAGNGSVHTPVLLHEVMTMLDPQPGDFVIDGTVDGGGHAAAILERIGPTGMLLGIDWDAQLLDRTTRRFAGRTNVRLLHGNYADLPRMISEDHAGNGVRKADGLLIDLGFSSEQLEASGRGFSFRSEYAHEPLLMTYDDSQTPLYEILRQESESSLANIIFEFGGERGSRRIARAIKEAGRKKPIGTSGELAEIIRDALPKGYEHGRIDPATRTFQAFRIYANGELENLKALLGKLREILKPGGRAVIITFHSVEDGMVKRAFRDQAKEGTLEILTKKPIEASREEIKTNPRSRSAKIRAARIN